MSEDISMNELFRLSQFYLDQDKTELAMRYLELAAECGHAEAQFQFSTQLSMDQQDDLSLEWLIEAHNNGYGPASRTLIMHLWERDSVSSNEISEVIEWYRDSENTWRGDRTLELAEFLFYCKRKNEGLAELRKAALLDNAEACRDLGLLHLKNQVANPNVDEGLLWLTKAADLGSGWATDELSDIYLKGNQSKDFPGIQVEVDKDRAVKLLEKNASRGRLYSAKILGTLYLHGLWIKADYLLAEKWLLEAANAPMASVQLMLADEYSSGEKLPKRLFEAVYWYRRAASSNGEAALKLCKLIASEEFSIDFSECIFWFNHAIEHEAPSPEKIRSIFDFMQNGRFTSDQKKQFLKSVEKHLLKLEDSIKSENTDFAKGSAAYRISSFYAIGLGVPLDKSLSSYWLNKAASFGLPIAKWKISNKDGNA